MFSARMLIGRFWVIAGLAQSSKPKPKERRHSCRRPIPNGEAALLENGRFARAFFVGDKNVAAPWSLLRSKLRLP